MKRLISILLAVSMVFTMLSIPLAAFAGTVYEYTETFDSASHSFNLGNWAYDDTAKNIKATASSQMAKFTDPVGVLSNAVNYEISAEFVLGKNSQNAIVFKADANYSNYIMFRRSSSGKTEFMRMGINQGVLATGTVNSALVDGKNTIKVVVQGNTYTGYINDTEMLTYTDNNATAYYNVGVRSNINPNEANYQFVTVDNFSVVNLDKPTLTEETDTFENADNWNLGTYWTHDSTDKHIETTANGQVVTFKDNDGVIANTNDYIVSADFTTTAASGQHSITFRHSGNNFYMFRVAYQKAEFYKMGTSTGSIATAANTIIQNSAGETYNLKIMVNGTKFTGYYNGVEIFSIDDSTYTTGGIGFRSNGGVSVDNFYVQRLDANADLKSISVDGTAISGFNADTTDYSVSIAEGAAYPTVSVAAVNSDLTAGNGITIEQASDANSGVATITVVSESGKATKTYKVSFVEPVVEALDTFESDSGWNKGSIWKYDAENERAYATSSNGIMSYNDSTGVIARSNNNYVVSADLVFEGGNGIGATSLVFRKQDNNNYYMFRVNGGKADFYRMGGSKSESIATGTAEIPNLALGSVINLKVVVKGNTFVGYVNGVKQLEVSDSEFTTGSVGIRSNLNGTGTVYADNFYVCRADAEMKLVTVAVPDGSGVLVSQIPSNNNCVLAVPDNNVYTVTAEALDSTDTVVIEQTDDFNKPATITITNADETKTDVYNVYFVQRNGADIPKLQGYAYCESEEGNTLTFTGSVLNTSSDTRGIALLAAYDTATGKLIAVKKSADMTKFSGKCAVTPVEFGAIEAESDSVDIKVFLWDNLTDVTPLSAVNAFTLKKKITESKDIKDVLGVTAWGSVYRLDDTKSQLVEMADEIAEINSSKIKVLLGPSYKTAYLYENFGDAEYATMTELAQTEQYSTLFSDERFDTIAISASEMTQQNWRNGFKQSEKEYVENEFYEFAAYLLTTYKDTGKTFILQNWEGDNLLKAWEEDLTNQSVAETQNMKFEGFAQYMNARQAGVERARKEFGTDGVNVVNAFEVMAVPADSIGDNYYFKVNDNGDIVKCPLMVDILIGNEPRINPDGTKTYFTRIKADLYSISSWHTSNMTYEALQPDGSYIKPTVDEWNASMAERLNYMSERALPSDVYGNQNIMIGEFGAKEYYNSADVDGQAQIKKNIVKGQVDSFMTVPQLQYAFYWQLYCNGIRDAENNAWSADKKYSNSELMGGWLIRPDGSKPPVYDYIKGLLTTGN